MTFPVHIQEKFPYIQRNILSHPEYSQSKGHGSTSTRRKEGGGGGGKEGRGGRERERIILDVVGGNQPKQWA